MNTLPRELLEIIAHGAAIEFSGASMVWNQYVHDSGLYVRDTRFNPVRCFSHQHPSLVYCWKNVEQRLTFLEWATLKDQRRLIGYILTECPWSSGKNGARSITMAIRLQRIECLRILINALSGEWFFRRYNLKIYRSLILHPNVPALEVIVQRYISDKTQYIRLLLEQLSRRPELWAHVPKMITIQPYLKDVIFVKQMLECGGSDMYDHYLSMTLFPEDRRHLYKAILLDGTPAQFKKLIELLRDTTEEEPRPTKLLVRRLVEVFKVMKFDKRTSAVIRRLRASEISDTEILEILMGAMSGTNYWGDY